MPEIKITTDNNSEEPKKQIEKSAVEKGIETAMEYQKLREENDALEKEILRREELRNRQMISGRANAGQYTPEKSKEEIAKEEAYKILKMFR